MPHEKQKGLAALPNGPALESITVNEVRPPWPSRQSDFDFLEWSSVWREAICGHDFNQGVETSASFGCVNKNAHYE